MDVLIIGNTGSGKTQYIIDNASDFIRNFHRVFHLVPTSFLKLDVFHRYQSRYGSIVSSSFNNYAKIFVLTYSQFNQFLTFRESLVDDVIVYDEFHVIVDDFFKKQVYSAIVNVRDYFKRFFISATPVKLPFIKFSQTVKLEGGGSRYKIVKLDNSADVYNLIINNMNKGKSGFMYVHSINKGVEELTKLYSMLKDVNDINDDFDNDLLKTFVKRGIAYISSLLTENDKKQVIRLIEDGVVKFVTATTMINYGVNLKFDYAVFPTSKFLDKIRLLQFFGRVGRFSEGEIYVKFDPNALQDPTHFEVDQDTEEFAKLIALDQEYLCKRYDFLCDFDMVKTLAYHLIPPRDAERIVNFEILRVNDLHYKLCVISALSNVPKSLYPDDYCFKNYSVYADSEHVDMMKRWLNLENVQLTGRIKKMLDEFSYTAHIISILKDAEYDNLSLSLKFGIPPDKLKELLPLLDLPYIGRYRAMLLYQHGITKENFCERKKDVVRLLGKWGEKVVNLICN